MPKKEIPPMGRSTEEPRIDEVLADWDRGRIAPEKKMKNEETTESKPRGGSPIFSPEASYLNKILPDIADYNHQRWAYFLLNKFGQQQKFTALQVKGIPQIPDEDVAVLLDLLLAKGYLERDGKRHLRRTAKAKL